ncbi:hypothetical protein NOM01_04455 [Sporolactobacillus sp. STSJ-5]|nr:hypothetical protein [Sporolactobacillus sp. STSJ-5]MCQ2009245.1 hypothetical protein [Sporolactobacillus sp. STSJ-5]
MIVHYKGKKRNKKMRDGKPLTEEDIKRLMNIDTPIYHRTKGGAWKQK